MKAPDFEFGGICPVVAYFRHSITVVFPLPLCPTINVNGEKNCIVSFW